MIRSALYGCEDFGLSAALKTGLVAWWKFDETQGTRVNSVTPGTLDLTSSAPTTDHYAAGKFGNAATFNGKYLYHDYDANFVLNNTDFSFQMWLKISADYFNPVFRHCNLNGSAQDLSFYCNSRTQFVVAGYTGAPAADVAFNGSSLALDTWNHVVLTHNLSAKRFKVFVNGAQYGSQHVYTGSIGESNTPIFLGAYTSSGESNYLTLDDFAFWRRELSSAEITTLYNSNAGITYS